MNAADLATTILLCASAVPALGAVLLGVLYAAAADDWGRR
jgi:hypothetical protein